MTSHTAQCAACKRSRPTADLHQGPPPITITAREGQQAWWCNDVDQCLHHAALLRLEALDRAGIPRVDLGTILGS